MDLHTPSERATSPSDSPSWSSSSTSRSRGDSFADAAGPSTKRLSTTDCSDGPRKRHDDTDAGLPFFQIPLGFEHDIAANCCVIQKESVVVIIWRGKPDFTDLEFDLIAEFARETGLAYRRVLERHTERIGPIKNPKISELNLTHRETEVLKWIAAGKSNPEIALILAVSKKTIAKHVEHILEKLGAENRTVAAGMAREAGLE